MAGADYDYTVDYTPPGGASVSRALSGAENFVAAAENAGAIAVVFISNGEDININIPGLSGGGSVTIASTKGLKPGDRIITQGTANLKQGAAIRAVPASAPQRVVPGKPGGGAGNRVSGRG